MEIFPFLKTDLRKRGRERERDTHTHKQTERDKQTERSDLFFHLVIHSLVDSLCALTGDSTWNFGI